MRELFSVIANEWMKLIHRRRLLIAGILCVFVVGLYAFGMYTYHKNIMHYGDTPQNLSTQIQSLNQQMDVLNHTNNPHKQEELANMQQQLQQLKTELAYMKGMESTDWKPLIQQDIVSKQQAISSIQNSGTSISESQQISNQNQIDSMNAAITKDKYFLDNNIKPLNGDNPYRMIQLFMNILSYVFLPLIIVVLVGDMVSGESTSGTIKLLLVRPISRKKILLGKWIVSVLSSITLSGILCAVGFLSNLLIFGVKGGKQPTFVGIEYTFKHLMVNTNGLGGPAQNMVPVTNYQHAFLLPEWELFVYGILLLMFAMAIVSTITFLFSTFFKSAVASTIISIGVIFVGYIVSKMMGLFSLQFTRYIFSTNLDLVSNWSGTTAQTLLQPITLGTGIYVLLIWGIVSLVLSIIIFSRRDILNA